MSVEFKEHCRDAKLKRFITFLLELEGKQLKDVLEHLPEEFENLEHETICQMIKRVVGKICRCRSKLCCF